ncbi:CdaR family protein [Alicyclobacillus dauci]|uniref:CdaR family protein n=1 Tax=Alicyclobacillus dauci TaxID=1475485 RepID=A0ABY6Z530_9BACL|nr:CdaR family protein [Alicyclobacillus dauci]WAH37431.1 CdaR family protein [Alicyclobacillus dauci]
MDRFLRNNNVLRILALVLACIIWLAVHAPTDASASTPQQQSGMTLTQDYQFAIHVESGDDVVVASMDQSTATVKVTAGYLRIPSLPADMLKVQLVANAQGLGPGTQTLNIAAVGMPNDVKRYTIVPQTVTVVLEKKVHVQKPIDVQVKGTPAQGYSLGSFKLNTESVDVSGANSLVQSVAQVVGTLDVTGMKDSGTKIVNLTPVDVHGNPVQNVDLAPSTISVDVPIQTSEEKVKLQPEVTGSPAPGYAVSGVTLDNQDVSEAGLAQSDLPANGLNVPIDVTGLSQTKTLTVPVPLLQGMTKVTPDTVSATVTIEPSATVTLKQVPVSVQNQPKGKTVTLPDAPKVDVTLTGPQSVISKLSAKDIQAYVDASTLKPNQNQADVTIRVPKWVSVTDISQRTVAVQIG